MEVFTKLDDQSLTGEELGKALNIHPRGIFDFFDALVALGFLYRDGDGSSGRYRNTEATAQYLNKHQPGYMGGFFEMCNDRLFKFWSDLGPALKTGKPQNETKHNQKPMYASLLSKTSKTLPCVP